MVTDHAPKLLEGLNDAQKQAVTSGEGPLLIIAGAGTGKTTVITRRIAWLLATGKAKPEEVLALTFTEKAAQEMAERVDLLLPYGYLDLWVLTFHGFAEKILAEFGMEIGLSPDAKLLDETETCLLMRDHWERFSLEYFEVRGNPAKQIREFYDHFSRLQDEGITPDEYLAYAMKLPETTPEEAEEAARRRDLAKAYGTYEDILAERSAIDFGGLMLRLYELLVRRASVREKLGKRFTYILVDEFQDTNTVQYRIVKLLTSVHQNITIVGDDDQAIYRFRGASYTNLTDFVRDYPKAAKVVLVENYRSKQEVLDASYAFIVHNNPHRLEAMLASSGEVLSKKLVGLGSGGFVKEQVYDRAEAEAIGVAKTMLDLKNADPSLLWSDFCVLLRANSAAPLFVHAFETAKIPHRFFGLQGLYRKPVIVDILALCRLLVRSYDSVAATRVLAGPAVRLPEADLMALLEVAERDGKQVFQVARNHQAVEGVSAEGRQLLDRFLETYETTAKVVHTKNAPEALLTAMTNFSIIEQVARLPEGERAEELRHITQLYERAERFVRQATDPRLQLFMQKLDHEMELGDEGALRGDPEIGPEYVRIMTVHGAKGLEFKYVFIVQCVEQKFPSTKRERGIDLPPALLGMTEEASDTAHLEEERRLMYVALTRAKEGAYLTRATDYGGERKRKASRFLGELGFVASEPTKEEERFDAKGNEEVVLSAMHPKIPKRLSFTQLSAFERCPLQYKFAHLYRVPVFGNPASTFGRTMHTTLENLFRSYREAEEKGEPITMDEAGVRALYDAAWSDAWYPDDATREEYRMMGWLALRKIHGEALENPPHPVYLEQDFTLKIGEFVIKGRIDRVDRLPDGTYEIVDYKSGNPKTEEMIKKDRDSRRQLTLYYLAAREALGIEVTKMTYYYLTDNTTVTLAPKPKEVEKLREEILEIGEALKTTTFPPQPDYHCRHCDFRNICEYRKLK